MNSAYKEQSVFDNLVNREPNPMPPFGDYGSFDIQTQLISVDSDDITKVKDVYSRIITGQDKPGSKNAKTMFEKGEPKNGISNENTRPSVRNFGRIPKNSTEKGEHDRTKKDNIIRKIKAHYLKYIIKRLNKCIKNKKYQFLLVNPSISELLTRSFNRRLFRKSFGKILYTTNISFNYKSLEKTLQVNRDAINYIYDPKKDEKEAYIILKKKYVNQRLFSDFAEYYKKELNKKKMEKKKLEESEEEDEKEDENYYSKIVPYLEIDKFMGFFGVKPKEKPTE